MRRINFASNVLIKRKFIDIHKILKHGSTWLPIAKLPDGKRVDGVTVYRVKSFNGIYGEKYRFTMESSNTPKWYKKNEWNESLWNVDDSFMRFQFPTLYKPKFFFEITDIKTGFEKKYRWQSWFSLSFVWCCAWMGWNLLGHHLWQYLVFGALSVINGVMWYRSAKAAERE